MITCAKCESPNVIKYGFNQTSKGAVQKHKCLSCGTIFCHAEMLPNSQISSEIVSLCLDLYLKGLSYRVIKQQLLEQFGLKVSHVTIYCWIQEYSNLLKNYADTLKPKLSAVWQMDETFLAFKGRRVDFKHPGKHEGRWCWIAIDTGTRYILDCYLTFTKQLQDGVNFFDRLKEAIQEEPDVVATDGNSTYANCIKEYYPKATHIKLKLISWKPNTSFIERFNGTVKNRTKTMRCFDEFRPCQNFMTLFQIYYNFLRPHMALNGKTPAQAAGIELNLPLRWVSLIRQALVVTHFN